MKSLVFDSSTIISLSLNNLLYLLPDLKHRFQGQFFITEAVKKELIDNPMHSKKFKLEALQIHQLILDNTIEIYGQQLEKQTQHLLNLTNNLFKAENHFIRLVDKAEVESLALANLLKATYAVDERTIRMLIENPNELKNLFEKKLHTKITINNDNLKELQKEINVNIIRSSELGLVAYSLGLLKNLTQKDHLTTYNLKHELIDGILWGLKLNGCAISQEEIEQAEKTEGF